MLCLMFVMSCVCHKIKCLSLCLFVVASFYLSEQCELKIIDGSVLFEQKWRKSSESNIKLFLSKNFEEYVQIFELIKFIH